MRPQPGWYPDPSGRPRSRYWDGVEWTDRVIDESSADAALRARAEQQEQWIAQGDSRGVYGDFGAQLMDSLADQRQPLGSQAEIAQLARTDAELEALIEHQPAMWTAAVFVSVIVQRRIALERRLSEVRLGSRHPNSLEWKYGDELSRFGFEDEIDRQIRLAEGLINFVTPERFIRALNQGDQVDPELIIETANQLMDYHRRYLELADSIRVYCNPDTLDIQRFVWGQLIEQLDKFDTFINELVDVLSAGEDALRYSSGQPTFTANLKIVANKPQLERCKWLIRQRHEESIHRRVAEALQQVRQQRTGGKRWGY